MASRVCKKSVKMPHTGDEAKAKKASTAKMEAIYVGFTS